MKTKEILKKIRELMEKKGIEAYFITTSDYHQSEYIGEYFKLRQYISGFTGSFGNLIITNKSASLWTDSRYGIQAFKELEGSGIEVFVLGAGQDLDFKKWILENTNDIKKIAFDGKTVSAKLGLEIEEFFKNNKIDIDGNFDLGNIIWENRPNLEKEKAFLLEEKYTGEGIDKKISRVREKMKKDGCQINILTTLDDIAWLFNMRGGDVANNPVTLAYAIIEEEKTILYIDSEKLEDTLKEEFLKNNIEIREYEGIYCDLKNIDIDKKVLIDSNKINYLIKSLISKNRICDTYLPTTIFKAIKNEIEIKNTRNAHIKDGVAITKFIYWLKNNVSKEKITELTAQEKIDSLRTEQELYLSPSFGTISAYMSNAAMPHYSAKEETNLLIENKGLYLLDSGGQYLDGTTDITRTIAVGELTEELKRDNTLVLKGMLSLSDIKFVAGTPGMFLDAFARKAMWEYGINFNHGTGHGVGHVLGVHEGPQGISPRLNTYPLEIGMVVTNEPGIYKKDSHGIRIENELLIVKHMETEFGKFYKFEPLTCAPIDLDAIKIEMLSCEEKKYLNDYHNWVYETLKNKLTIEEANWLKEYTRKI